jgi:L-asparaginase
MPLRIITTGGTFDKHYDALAGELTFAASHVDEIVKRCRLTVPVSIEQVSLLDSLDMTHEDRERVLASCQKAEERAIVVVHGTDTMSDTAEVLGPALAAGGKTVVLTGAMVPYVVRGSDALFNLGFAVAASQMSKPGVYIAMNGRVFGWSDVKKNKAMGVFQAKG